MLPDLLLSRCDQLHRDELWYIPRRGEQRWFLRRDERYLSEL